MKRLTVKELKEKESVNLDRLAKCHEHEFEVFVVGIDKWECNHCGGQVNDTAKQWYEKGLCHGLKAGQQPRRRGNAKVN